MPIFPKLTPFLGRYERWKGLMVENPGYFGWAAEGIWYFWQALNGDLVTGYGKDERRGLCERTKKSQAVSG